ncbi:T9SS type A sorting domain-containing protein [Polaribacter aestuariivivens]|uniref:T9SS type A sorting domain-containing protein n=1 Tax=Polaribacter aestuariivivens TaxID=2304626 RepID=UPI003F4932F7
MKKTLLYSLYFFSLTLTAQIQVASDVNQGNFGSSIEDVFKFKNNLFFSAELNDQFSSTSERKLWKTDGTEAGTIQVGNLPPKHYFPSDNVIYYTNINDEIWKTDGTEANTSKIHDGKSYFDPLGSFKDNFYYMEITADATGIGLFKTNGTDTILLKTFAGEENTRSAIYNDNNAVFKFNEEKCVILLESKSTGINAYISDGTADKTELLHDSSKGALTRTALEFHTLNNNLTVYTDNNKRVWVTDGTLNGTSLIKTLTGQSSRKIHSMTVLNNKIYFGFLFTADFWETDGTEAGTKELFTNINNDGNVQGIVKRENDLVIFTQKGIHLFDGTSTTKINTPDITNINYYSFEKVDDNIYFTANYKNQGNRVWVTNGLENGTYSLTPFWPDNAVPTYQLHSVNGKFIFTLSGSSYAYNTGEIWVSDGTDIGTKLLKDINKTGNLDSKPKFQTTLNGKVYFAADDNVHGRELFVFDGATTTLVKDIYPGFNSSNPYDFYVLNDKIIFKAYTLENGLEFWITDGTESGTVLLKDINPNGNGFLNDNRAYVRINQFKIFNNELYFFADNGTNGMELWKTNGTEAGTIMLKDINPGFNASYRPALDQRPRIVEHNNELYFYVSSSGSSNNLSYFQMWKTDGTTAGTQKISIIENTIKEGTLLPNTYFSFNNNFYFYGVDKLTNKKELYRTDFNTVTKIEGTGNHTAFYPVKDKIYYTNNDFVSGKGEEIWAIEKDDSFAIAHDIVPGSQGSNAGNFYVFNDYLYFSIRNQNYESELWRVSNNTVPEKVFTKDTETGTSSIEQYFDFIPKNDILFINTKHHGNSDFIYRMYAIKNSSTNLTPVLSVNSFKVPYENLPNGINSLSTFLNNKIYFTGNISEEGEELLVANFEAVLSIDKFKNLSDDNFGFNIYPNPVDDLLNINSKSTIKSGIIYNLLGKKVVTINSNSTDVSKLKAGVYILKIKDEFGNISSKKWIKK